MPRISEDTVKKRKLAELRKGFKSAFEERTMARALAKELRNMISLTPGEQAALREAEAMVLNFDKIIKEIQAELKKIG